MGYPIRTPCRPHRRIMGSPWLFVFVFVFVFEEDGRTREREKYFPRTGHGAGAGARFARSLSRARVACRGRTTEQAGVRRRACVCASDAAREVRRPAESPGRRRRAPAV